MVNSEELHASQPRQSTLNYSSFFGSASLLIADSRMMNAEIRGDRFAPILNGALGALTGHWLSGH